MSAELIFSTLATLVDDRVYTLIAPEGQALLPPYIIYDDSISNNPLHTLEGYTGHERVRVQIDVYDESFDNCIELSKKVIWAMEDKQAEYISQTQFYDFDVKLFRRSLDFWLWRTSC